jgi:hypothetical protein
MFDLGASGDRASLMARWERERSRGRTAFIWRHGVAAWGLPAACLTIAYKVFQEVGTLGAGVIESEFSTHLRVAIAVCLVFFPAMGHMLGQKLWDAGEERYRRMKRGSPR